MPQEKNHRQLERRGKKSYVARSGAIFLMLDHEKVVRTEVQKRYGKDGGRAWKRYGKDMEGSFLLSVFLKFPNV